MPATPTGCQPLCPVQRPITGTQLDVGATRSDGTGANRETGAIEQQTVLSVHYPREEFQALRFDGIDPSDSMRRFVHNKDFKRGEGLRPVAPLVI